MKVIYDGTSQKIKIEDTLKKNYLVIKFLMILNIFNGIAFTLGFNNETSDFFKYIWMFLGAISLVVLLMLIFKKTSANTISIHEIEALKQKNILGQKRLSLQLKNGKIRDLSSLKKEEELDQTKNLFSSLNVKVI
ncbi:hypothetical protein [Ascidiimonas aurantiaca]|uniref:hypothetical protein n=1 Tax=Ascidiimonas aurantiaca TaxID=1685432 RepID=UPI0030EE7DC7